VEPSVDFGTLPDVERLLLADAQTSGGLLVAAALPGCPVIGELVSRGEYDIVLRG
jgi:selenide,water dikinase